MIHATPLGRVIRLEEEDGNTTHPTSTPSTLSLLSSRTYLRLRKPPPTPQSMTTRSAEEAELSDSAPDPVRIRTDDAGPPVEQVDNQPTEANHDNDHMDALDAQLYEAQLAARDARTANTGSSDDRTTNTNNPDTLAVDKKTLDAFTYVKAIKINHLDIHAWDTTSILENINPVQRNMWINAQGTKVLAYKAYGGYVSDQEEVAILRKGIKEALGLSDHPIVAPPTPAVHRSKREAAPLCAMISGLTQEKAKALIAKRFLSFKEFTVVFSPFEPPPFTFATTLKGFVFLDLEPDLTTQEVHRIVTATLFEGGGESETTMQVKRFLTTNRDGIPNTFRTMDDLVKYLQITLTVERLDLVSRDFVGTGEGKTHPAWNIYIQPPTLLSEGMREWRSLIRSMKFVTLANGSGATGRLFRCTICQSENHPAGMCRLPDQVGWIKPAPQTSEALSSILNPTTSGRGRSTTGRGGGGTTTNGRGGPTTRGRGRGGPRT